MFCKQSLTVSLTSYFVLNFSYVHGAFCHRATKQKYTVPQNKSGIFPVAIYWKLSVQSVQFHSHSAACLCCWVDRLVGGVSVIRRRSLDPSAIRRAGSAACTCPRSSPPTHFKQYRAMLRVHLSVCRPSVTIPRRVKTYQLISEILVLASLDSPIIRLLLTFSSNCGSVLHRFKIFDYEKYCDLEVRVRGHSRSPNW